MAVASGTVVVAPGIRVPYPEPSSDAASAIGRANKRRDTKPEVALRSALHPRGLRFRKDHPIPTAERRVRVDIAFTRQRIAVLVDGCFWHGCPQHHRPPKTNQAYWGPKLAANRSRDKRVDRLLADAGWTVVRVWEHENSVDAADHIASIVHRSQNS